METQNYMQALTLKEKLVDNEGTMTVSCSFDKRNDSIDEEKAIQVDGRSYCVTMEYEGDEWATFNFVRPKHESRVELHLLVYIIVEYDSTEYHLKSHQTILAGEEYVEVYFIGRSCRMSFQFSLIRLQTEYLFDNTDVFLVCEGEEFAVCRAYMSQWSAYLESLFAKEKEQTTFNIDICSSRELERFLRFTTSLSIDNLNERDAIELCRVAGKLMAPQSLTYACEEALLAVYEQGFFILGRDFMQFDEFKMDRLIFVILARIQSLRHFKKVVAFDWHSDLSHNTAMMFRKRKVELSEKNKDMKREEKELEEFEEKKKEEEKRKETRKRMKKRQEKKKEKMKEKERRKERKRRQQKRNA